jgi:hypothetical protein
VPARTLQTHFTRESSRLPNASYAEAMVFATTMEQLVNPEEPKLKRGFTAEEIAKMDLLS